MPDARPQPEPQEDNGIYIYKGSRIQTLCFVAMQGHFSQKLKQFTSQLNSLLFSGLPDICSPSRPDVSSETKEGYPYPLRQAGEK